MSIEIPPEARAKYLERRQKDLTDCRQAIQNSDFEIPMRVGHQLKGNAQTFGFDPLTSIGIRLEEGGKHKNLAEIKSAVSDFEVYLKSQIST